MDDEPAVTDLRYETDAWTALVTLAGRKVSARNDDLAKDCDRDVVAAVFAHVASIVAARVQSVVVAATQALLATYNDSWRDPAAPPLSALEFARRLVLDGIRSSDPENPSRLITLYFTCGDLFGDHMIEAMLEWDGTPLGAPSLIG